MLLVDGDADARTRVAHVLERYYLVSQAGDAIRAVSTARAFLPDVVVVDYVVPAGHAADVAARVRALPGLATTPLVLRAAWEEPWTWQELLELDGAFVPKNDERGLLVEIERALAG